MSTTEISQKQSQQQEQQQQNMSDALLRENDVDPRTALSANARRVRHGGCSNISPNRTNCNCYHKTNNKIDQTNDINSCHNNNNNNKNNMAVLYGRKNLKFSLFICAILCSLLAAQSVEGAPRIKRGNGYIHHTHRRAAPKIRIQEMEEKLKSAETVIKCALRGASVSNESLPQLTEKFYKLQYNLNEPDFNLSLWKPKMDHVYDDHTKIKFDLSSYEKILTELYNIKKALEILQNLLEVVMEERRNHTLESPGNNYEGPEIEGQIDDFFKLSLQMLNLNLADVGMILTELGQDEQQQSQVKTKKVTWKDVYHKSFFVAQNHKRILSIIVDFYQQLLQRIEASDDYPSC